MTWRVPINGMNADYNFTAIFIMGMVKMDERGCLKKTKDLKNGNKY
jgi:hypothetical protein